MKSFKIVILLVMLAMSRYGFSQITLTRPDFPVIYDHSRAIYPSNISSITEGPQGSNMLWDFSTLDTSSGPFPYILHYVPASFECNNEDLRGNYSPTGTGGDSYNYFTNASNYDLLYSQSWYYSSYSYARCYNNVWKKMAFPFTYTDSLISIFDFYSSYWNGMTSTTYSTGNGYDSTYCDSWGTLIIPSGVFDVLRTVSNILVVDTNYASNNPYYNYLIREFNWYTNMHKCPLLTIHYRSDFNPTTNTWSPIGKSVRFCSSSYNSVGFDEHPLENQQLILSPIDHTQSYVIHFSNYPIGKCEVFIFDLQGKLILQTKINIDSNYEKSEVNLQSLTQGVYTIRSIPVNGKSQSLKFVKL